MTDKIAVKEEHKFWTRKALNHGESPAASWSDTMAIEIEIKEICKHLTDGDKALDVGCANGYSTVRFASQKHINIRGIDFVPQMIELARLRASKLHKNVQNRLTFEIGDITDLKESTGKYDKVIATRVLINLVEWDNQVRAIHECARVLKRGGLLLLSEATLQGWQQMNKFRQEWGLSAIPMPHFNQYLDQDKIIDIVSEFLQLVEISNFSSTYYICTRIFKPLLIKALGIEKDVADPNMEWNRWAAHLPSWGDYGVQKLFVFRKL
jgi:ubiquinone/menaquinone biosynthesis C-methylase UbiE